MVYPKNTLIQLDCQYIFCVLVALSLLGITRRGEVAEVSPTLHFYIAIDKIDRPKSQWSIRQRSKVIVRNCEGNPIVEYERPRRQPRPLREAQPLTGGSAVVYGTHKGQGAGAGGAVPVYAKILRAFFVVSEWSGSIADRPLITNLLANYFQASLTISHCNVPSH